MNRRPPLADSHGGRPPVALFHLRPWLLAAMMALVVARPLFPSESAATYGDGLTMVMLWIALALFWLLGAIGRPKFSLRFGWTDAAMLIVIGWHCVAALWAVAHGTPRPAVNILWEWVGMGLCFFLARQLLATPREVRALAAVMIALAVALSAFGLYQRAWQFPRTQAAYEANPDRALRDAGLWFPPHSPERKLFEDRLQNTEPTATFALTNSLAAFLAPWLIMLVGITVGGIARRPIASDKHSHSDGHRLTHLGRLAGLLILLIPLAMCLLATRSRSGYVAACVGLLLVWWLSRERKILIGWKLPAAAVGVAVALISAAVAVEGSAVLDRATKSLGYRLQYWQSTARMIADHPWMGCGPGNFQEVYTQYKLPQASEEIADPHNFLLEIWATAGTPAALAFLAMLACFARQTKQGRGAGGEHCQGLCRSALTLTLSQRERGPQAPTHNPQSPIPCGPPDAWRHVLIGGAIGFLLSLPLGMLSAAPPGIVPVLLGLPLAAVAIATLLGWIRKGLLPGWLPVVGLVVLLVDLSAAGGIGFPGVAGTFWLLLAIGLHGQEPRAFPLQNAWIALAGVVALAVACYSTAYRPVLGCQVQLRLADRADGREVEHLEAAVSADPLAAGPWRRLAAIRFDAWRQVPSLTAFDRFQQADAMTLRREPNSAPAWLLSGDWHFEAAELAGRRGEKPADLLRKAVSAYRRAVELYPTSALSRAKLAEAYDAAGNRSAFRLEAKAALRLDQTTPHTDKKLPDRLREKLVHDLGLVP